MCPPTSSDIFLDSELEAFEGNIREILDPEEDFLESLLTANNSVSNVIGGISAKAEVEEVFEGHSQQSAAFASGSGSGDDDDSLLTDICKSINFDELQQQQQQLLVQPVQQQQQQQFSPAAAAVSPFSQLSQLSPQALPDVKVEPDEFKVLQQLSPPQQQPPSRAVTSVEEEPEFGKRKLTSVEEESEFCKRKLTCKVCGDGASGFHYRVASCEACKAFFKRTVQGKIEYYCQTDGNCKISVRGRKACQACRFQKCIRVGMLKEGVRTDRTRGGRQKYYRKVHLPSIASVDQVYNAIFETLRGLDIDETRPARHLALCPYSGRVLEMADIHRGTKFTPMNIWNIVADLYNKQIESTIIPMKNIPGLSEFSVEDQMNLFRGGWSEIQTLSLIYHSKDMISGKKCLQFAPNLYIHELLANLCGMENYFHKCMGIVSKIAQSGGMHHEEFLLLKALILANVDIDMEDPSRLLNLRDNVLGALNSKVSSLRGALQGTMHVQKLLMLLPAIREADMAMKGLWSEHKGEIHINNTLFLDMLQ